MIGAMTTLERPEAAERAMSQELDRVVVKSVLFTSGELACLLHDIAIAGFIRSDHGYWGAQLLEPYVDEEVAWAIRYHQALRFFADESVGYRYPDM